MTAPQCREPVDVGRLDEPELRYPVVVETKSFFLVWYPGESSEDAAAVMGEDSDWYEWLPPQSEAADHDWSIEPVDQHHWLAGEAFAARHRDIGPRLPDGQFDSPHATAVWRAEVEASRARRSPLSRPNPTGFLPTPVTSDGAG